MERSSVSEYDNIGLLTDRLRGNQVPLESVGYQEIGKLQKEIDERPENTVLIIDHNELSAIRKQGVEVYGKTKIAKRTGRVLETFGGKTPEEYQQFKSDYLSKPAKINIQNDIGFNPDEVKPALDPDVAENAISYWKEIGEFAKGMVVDGLWGGAREGAERLMVNSARTFGDRELAEQYQQYQGNVDEQRIIGSGSFSEKFAHDIGSLLGYMAPMAVAGSSPLLSWMPLTMAAIEGTGQALSDMDEFGIEDDRIKYPIALAAGVLYGAIERLQLKQVAPWLNKGVKRTMFKGLKKHAMKSLSDISKRHGARLARAGYDYLGDVAKESIEEGAQEAVIAISRNMTAYLNDMVHGTELSSQIDWTEDLTNSYRAMVDSAAPLAAVSLVGRIGGHVRRRVPLTRYKIERKRVLSRMDGGEEISIPYRVKEANQKLINWIDTIGDDSSKPLTTSNGQVIQDKEGNPLKADANTIESIYQAYMNGINGGDITVGSLSSEQVLRAKTPGDAFVTLIQNIGKNKAFKGGASIGINGEVISNNDKSPATPSNMDEFIQSDSELDFSEDAIFDSIDYGQTANMDMGTEQGQEIINDAAAVPADLDAEALPEPDINLDVYFERRPTEQKSDILRQLGINSEGMTDDDMSDVYFSEINRRAEQEEADIDDETLETPQLEQGEAAEEPTPIPFDEMDIQPETELVAEVKPEPEQPDEQNLPLPVAKVKTIQKPQKNVEKWEMLPHEQEAIKLVKSKTGDKVTKSFEVDHAPAPFNRKAIVKVASAYKNTFMRNAKLYMFVGGEGNLADGFTTNNGDVFINLKSDVDTLQTIGHEGLHSVISANRKQWNELLSILRPALKDSKEFLLFRKSYNNSVNKLADTLKKSGETASAENLIKKNTFKIDDNSDVALNFYIEELMADKVGTSDKVWSSLDINDQNILKRILEILKQMISAIKRKGFESDAGLEKAVSAVEKMMKSIAEQKHTEAKTTQEVQQKPTTPDISSQVAVTLKKAKSKQPKPKLSVSYVKLKDSLGKMKSEFERNKAVMVEQIDKAIKDAPEQAVKIGTITRTLESDKVVTFDDFAKVGIPMPGGETFNIVNQKIVLQNLKNKISSLKFHDEALKAIAPKKGVSSRNVIPKIKPVKLDVPLVKKVLEMFVAGKDYHISAAKKPHYNRERGEGVSTNGQALFIIKNQLAESLEQKDSKYLDYWKLIPDEKNYSDTINIDVVIALNELDIANIMSDDSAMGAIYAGNDGKLGIYVKNFKESEEGSFVSDNVANGEFLNVVNIKTLKDILRAAKMLGQDTIELHKVKGDETKPLILTMPKVNAKVLLAGIIDRSGNNAFINKAKGLPQALATDRTAYSLQRMVGNLDSVKRNDVEAAQQIVDDIEMLRLQPERAYIPKTARSNSRFKNASKIDDATIERIALQYERMAERAGIVPTDLRFHVGQGNAVVWQPYQTNDYLVGQFIGDVFAVSHFAPETQRSGVLALQDLLYSETPAVFAVPEKLASQLSRIGFKESRVIVPMMFHGEVQRKHVLVNNIFNEQHLQHLLSWYSIEVRKSGLTASLTAESRMLPSADAVTYDDGNVIPLSERFNPENEDIRYKIGNKRKEDIRQGLKNKLALSDESYIENIINEIESLGESVKAGGDSKTEKVAYHWTLHGTVRLPEDNPKILQAIKVAEIAKVNPLDYRSPMELIESKSDVEIKDERINPDSIPTLTNKKEIGHGITVYDVADSDKSRRNMRRIIDTHFGKDRNPWCLLQGDGNGNLTADSEDYWDNYNGVPKRVAFIDGKLCAFCASDTSEDTWWDRLDEPHQGIPVIQRIPNDELRRTGTLEVYEDGTTSEYKRIHKGNQQNGLYQEWYENGVKLNSINFKDGKKDGLAEGWDENGKKTYSATYKDGKEDGLSEGWHENGVKSFSENFKDGKRDGLSEAWHENGVKSYSANYKDGKEDGLSEAWHENGIKSYSTTYKDGERDGLAEAWYENGVKSYSTTYKDGEKHGLSEAWNSNGVKLYSITYKDGEEQRTNNTANNIISQDNENVRYSLTKLDEDYFKAVKSGDLEAVQKLVYEAAKNSTYLSDSDYQGNSAFNGAAPSTNGYYENKSKAIEAWESGEFEGDWSLADTIDRGIDNGELFRRINEQEYRRANLNGKESISNLRKAVNGSKKLTMYRSVPGDIAESKLRNGDWITPSKSYAIENAAVHGWENNYRIIEQEVSTENIWWDGNDINEWGYDDGNQYVYKNTKNNIKLLDPITYDDDGNVIPLSERFNQENEDIRYKIGNKRKEDIRQGLKNKLTLSDEIYIENIINEIESLGESVKAGGDSKTEKVAYHWTLHGTVRLPEDNPKILQAIKVAEIAKVNPLDYRSPMELIESKSDVKIKEERTNPDSIPTLTNKKEIGHGITVYDVANSDKSRHNMRRIIDTHFGKDRNPWCLLQGDGNGNLTADSKDYWDHYNGVPKRVAFVDGKLCAFCASDTSEDTWWDRLDKPHKGIPVIQRIPNDELKRMGTREVYQDGTTSEYKHIHKGNKQNGLYQEWHENGVKAYSVNYKDGKKHGMSEEWNENGVKSRSVNYKDGKRDGLSEGWYDNEVKAYSINYKDGKEDGLAEWWNENGVKSRSVNYKDGKRDGLSEEQDIRYSIAHRKIKTSELPDNLSRVQTLTSLPYLQKQPGYNAAKNLGNSKLAQDIAKNILSREKTIQTLNEFSQRIDRNKKVIFVPVLNIEQNNRLNELPNALAHNLSVLFRGGKVSTDILKNNSKANTGATLRERANNNITFTGEVPDKSAQIVIVDDNFTSGDTVLSLYQHLLDTGSSDVRGIVTFSSSRYGAKLKIEKPTIDKLKNRTNLSTEQIEEIIGNEIEYLTEAEANQIISFAHAKGRLISIYAPEGSKTLDKILPDSSVRAKATLVAESSEYSIAENSDSPYSSKSVKFSVNSDDNKDGNWTYSLDKVSKDAQGIITDIQNGTVKIADSKDAVLGFYKSHFDTDDQKLARLEKEIDEAIANNDPDWIVDRVYALNLNFAKGALKAVERSQEAIAKQWEKKLHRVDEDTLLKRIDEMSKEIGSMLKSKNAAATYSRRLAGILRAKTPQTIETRVEKLLKIIKDASVEGNRLTLVKWLKEFHKNETARLSKASRKRKVYHLGYEHGLLMKEHFGQYYWGSNREYNRIYELSKHDEPLTAYEASVLTRKNVNNLSFAEAADLRLTLETTLTTGRNSIEVQESLFRRQLEADAIKAAQAIPARGKERHSPVYGEVEQKSFLRRLNESVHDQSIIFRLIESVIRHMGRFEDNSIFVRRTYTPMLDASSYELLLLEAEKQWMDDNYKSFNLEKNGHKIVADSFVKFDALTLNSPTDKSKYIVDLSLDKMMWVYAHSQDPNSVRHLIATFMDNAQINEETAQRVVRHIVRKLPDNYKTAVDNQITRYGDYFYSMINSVYRTLYNADMEKTERHFRIRNLERTREDDFQLLQRENGFSNRQTSKGMMNARTGSALPFKEIGSYFSDVTNNMYEYIHTGTFTLPIRSARAFLNTKSIVSAMQLKGRRSELDKMKQWINALAFGKIPASETLISRMRQNLSPFALGFNPSPMLKQTAGLGAAMARVKTVPLMKALSQIVTSPIESWDYIAEKSIYMRNRPGTITLSQAQLTRRHSSDVMFHYSGKLATFRNISFIPMTITDKYVAGAAWLGTYNDQKAQNKPENVAVREADKAVRLTQNEASLINLTTMERESEILRNFVPFTNQTIKHLNLLVDAGLMIKDGVDKDAAVKTMLRTIIGLAVSATAVTTISGGMAGMLLPFEEPERIMLEMANSITAGIPLVGVSSDFLIQVAMRAIRRSMGYDVPFYFGGVDSVKDSLQYSPIGWLVDMMSASARFGGDKGIAKSFEAYRDSKDFRSFLFTKEGKEMKRALDETIKSIMAGLGVPGYYLISYPVKNYYDIIDKDLPVMKRINLLHRSWYADEKWFTPEGTPSPSIKRAQTEKRQMREYRESLNDNK